MREDGAENGHSRAIPVSISFVSRKITLAPLRSALSTAGLRVTSCSLFHTTRKYSGIDTRSLYDRSYGRLYDRGPLHPALFRVPGLARRYISPDMRHVRSRRRGPRAISCVRVEKWKEGKGRGRSGLLPARRARPTFLADPR